MEGWSEKERAWMRQALRLARRPRGRVSPNPRVGAVVVSRGRVVGRGAHRGPGEPHAEALALREAGPAARGALLVLTLEPCAHQGRTPPCVDAIREAGVGRVLCAQLDPDPRVEGRGARILRRAGVPVDVGLMADEARRLNEAYLHHRVTGRPFVTVKLALTLDGRIADRRRGSRWITGPASRRLVHRWRAEADAVVVGRGTVEADDPRLDARAGRVRQPARVVFDSALRLDAGRRVYRDADAVRRVAVAAARLASRGAGRPRAAAEARAASLAARGVEVWRLRAGRDGRPSPAAFLDRAGREGWTSVLIEGGAELASAFLRAGVVDRLALFYAPRILGGVGTIAGLGDVGVPDLDHAVRVEGARWRAVGEDRLLVGRPVRREKKDVHRHHS